MFKSRGSGVHDKCPYIVDYNADGSVSGKRGPYCCLDSCDYSETEGWNTPNYHKLVRQGKLVPYTPFRQYSVEGSVSGYSTARFTNGRWWRYDGSDIGRSSVPSKDYLDEVAGRFDPQPYLQAAASRVYSQGFDALSFLAELGKTIEMFRGAGFRLLDLLSSPKFKKLGDAWLEGRYGWRTLVFDIIDINQALTDFDSKRTRYTSRVGGSHRFVETSTSHRPHGSFDEDDTVIDSFDISIRGSVAADFVPSRFQLNPITTAWELTTLSFVIDWFISVGAALEATSLMILAESYTSCVGYYVSLNREFSRVVTALRSGTSSADVQTSGVITATRTLRNPQSVSLIPQINPRLTGFKVADLITLLLQRYSRR